jgi:hypothetical protein
LINLPAYAQRVSIRDPGAVADPAFVAPAEATSGIPLASVIPPLNLPA